MRKKKTHNLLHPNFLFRRYSDGGAAPGDSALGTNATPAQAEPEKAEPKGEPLPPEQTFTAAQVEQAKAEALEAYKCHQIEAQDFEKMTADEKVVFLQNQMADEKLSGYTAAQLAKEELSAEHARWLKGGDEKSTDENIKAFKALYAKDVQSGVEKRFKDNGYQPRGNAAGSGDRDEKKRTRGVSVE